MTADPSSILDPVTGLPLDQFSGIIQQIPLGSQVFPFADLNADGRMTRQPIYGDDIIPTSALVAGQDSTGEARLGLMDTTRKLYTREAVFQNLGKVIPDGETAPVDVNVVSGGGGGGGGGSLGNWVPYATTLQSVDSLFPPSPLINITTPIHTYTYFFGFTASVALDTSFTYPTHQCDFGFEMHGFPAGLTTWMLFGTLAPGNGSGWLGSTTWQGSWIPPQPIKCASLINTGTQGVGFVAEGDVHLIISAVAHFGNAG